MGINSYLRMRTITPNNIQIMSIKFKPIAKTSGITKKRLYYPSIVRTKGDVVYTNQIARELAELSSIDTGSVFCVLGNLPLIMHHHFANGQIVRLAGLGSFFPTLDCKGEGVESPELVNSKQIKKVNVMYRSEYTKNHKQKHICALTKDFTFERSNLYPWPKKIRNNNKIHEE